MMVRIVCIRSAADTPVVTFSIASTATYTCSRMTSAPYWCPMRSRSSCARHRSVDDATAVPDQEVDVLRGGPTAGDADHADVPDDVRDHHDLTVGQRGHRRLKRGGKVGC